MPFGACRVQRLSCRSSNCFATGGPSSGRLHSAATGARNELGQTRGPLTDYTDVSAARVPRQMPTLLLRVHAHRRVSAAPAGAPAGLLRLCTILRSAVRGGQHRAAQHPLLWANTCGVWRLFQLRLLLL